MTASCILTRRDAFCTWHGVALVREKILPAKVMMGTIMFTLLLDALKCDTRNDVIEGTSHALSARDNFNHATARMMGPIKVALTTGV